MAAQSGGRTAQCRYRWESAGGCQSVESAAATTTTTTEQPSTGHTLRDQDALTAVAGGERIAFD